MSDRSAPLRTLFLHPPSFDGFDGGAGARYQARREIRSFWYPTWLAQPAALVPGSRLVDAPPDGLTLERVAPLAREYDQVVMHTSTPSFGSDVRVAERLKDENPRLLVGMVGAHVAVLPEASLRATRAVDWVGVGEFDYACAEVAEGRPLAEVQRHRVSRRRPDPLHRRPGRPSRTWTRCPSSSTCTGAISPSRTTSSATSCIPTSRSTRDGGADPSAPSACGRRPWAGIGIACGARRASRPRWPGPSATSPRSGSSSSTTTRSRTTCRAPRRSPAGWAGSDSRGRATPRRTSRGGRSRSCGTTVFVSCWWATSPGISGS